MTAIPIYVYKKEGGTDCTNGGVSSKYDSLLCVCADGYIEYDENDPPENLVKVVKRHLFGQDIYHIEPVARPKLYNVGWMMGGNYAASCDSRFVEMIGGFGGFYGAIPIHDRQETREEYDNLSH